MGTEFRYKRTGRSVGYDHEERFPENDNHPDEGREEPALAGAETRRGKFATFVRASTKTKVPIRREVVQDMIPAETVGFIGGQSGAFKTFFALDLAASVATGDMIAGKKVFRSGGVVYLAYEGQGTLDERWAAICLNRRLHAPPPVYLVSDAARLDRDEAWENMFHDLLDLSNNLEYGGEQLQLVIIDTVNMSGMIPDEKENDSSTWAKVFIELNGIAKLLKCSIALVHHAGKDVNAGLRGSSAAHGAADFVIMCETERDAVSGEVSQRWVHLRKSRYGVEGPLARMDSERVMVTEDEEGNPVSTLVMSYDTEASYVAPARDGSKPKAASGPSIGESKRKLIKLFAELSLRPDGTNRWEADIEKMRGRWVDEYNGSPRAAKAAFERALRGNEKSNLKGLVHDVSNQFSADRHTLAYFGCVDSDTPAHLLSVIRAD